MLVGIKVAFSPKFFPKNSHHNAYRGFCQAQYEHSFRINCVITLDIIPTISHNVIKHTQHSGTTIQTKTLIVTPSTNIVKAYHCLK